MQKLVKDFERSKETPNNNWDERRIGPYLITEELLGVGTTGPVKLAKNMCSGARTAVKVVTKTVTRKKKEARKEIRILQHAEPHDNIIKLLHVEEDQLNIYIFTQLHELGDLYTYISRFGTFPESIAKILFRQMVEAVNFCQRRLKLCHHDVKLENFVFSKKFPSNEYQIALIDFGFAVDIGPLGDKTVKLKVINQRKCKFLNIFKK